ncbi:hypothetical protein niasHT_021047 [Heterodera trifolii]|uniref:Uncharacterized protein n=1 Tax=Heterodera trifolii TaxID=157864 RepID=A0ABD2KD43_9BILA
MAKFGHGMDRRPANADGKETKSKISRRTPLQSTQANQQQPQQQQQEVMTTTVGQNIVPRNDPNGMPNPMPANNSNLTPQQKQRPMDTHQTEGHLLKLKMPMEVDDVEEENFVRLRETNQTKMDTLNKEIAETVSQENITKLEKVIWHIFALTFQIVGIELNPTDQITRILQRTLNFDQLALALCNSNSELVLNSITTHLVNNEHLKKKAIFANIFSRINSQAKGIFGQPLGLIDANVQQMGGDRVENGEMKRLKVFFYYVRLFRELLGLLEMPFSGKVPQIVAEEISEKKVILFCIGTAKKQIENEFEKIVRGQNVNSAKGEQMIKAMQKLEELFCENERIHLASVAISFTLRVLLRRHAMRGELLKLMAEVQTDNIICVLLSKEPVDLFQIAKSSLNWTDRIEIVPAFVRIFNSAMQLSNEEFGTNDQQFKTARIGKVFVEVFRATKKLVNCEANSPRIKLLMAFLDESIGQLDAFFCRFNLAKKEMIRNRTTEKGFISDYLMENCINYIIKTNDASRKSG